MSEHGANSDIMAGLASVRTVLIRARGLPRAEQQHLTARVTQRLEDHLAALRPQLPGSRRAAVRSLLLLRQLARVQDSRQRGDPLQPPPTARSQPVDGT